jgi:hypothetical protein
MVDRVGQPHRGRRRGEAKASSSTGICALHGDPGRNSNESIISMRRDIRVICAIVMAGDERIRVLLELPLGSSGWHLQFVVYFRFLMIVSEGSNTFLSETIHLFAA